MSIADRYFDGVCTAETRDAIMLLAQATGHQYARENALMEGGERVVSTLTETFHLQPK